MGIKMRKAVFALILCIFFCGSVWAARWRPIEISWGALDSEISLSHLNHKPAGCFGFIKIDKRGNLYFEKDPEKRVRFWGVQITGYPVSAKEASTLAKRLASYGFNLWRGHIQLPSYWAAFDRFVYEMEKQGLYWYVQLGAGGVNYGPKERWHPHCIASMSCYLMEPNLWQKLKEKWKTFFNHTNPFTGKKYKDDPAIICVELTNENYLLTGWEGGQLIKKFPPILEDHMKRLWNQWLRVKLRKLYPDASSLKEALNKRWNDGTGIGLLKDEDPETDSVRCLPRVPQKMFGNRFSKARTRDLMEFFFWLQRRFFLSAKRYLRQLGVKVPIIGGNWSQISLPTLKSLQDMDIMDVHLYYDIPVPEDKKGRFKNHNPFSAYGLRNLETTMVSNMIYKKPFSVSETNWMYPNEYQFMFLPTLSAYASFYDWDIVVLFHHSAKPSEYIVSFNNIEANPLILSQNIAAALCFRKYYVDKAKRCIHFIYGDKFIKETYLDSLTEDWVHPSLPYPIKCDGILCSLPWYIALEHSVAKSFDGDDGLKIFMEDNNRRRSVQIKDVGAFFREIISAKSRMISDTGELLYDPEKELFVIDSSKIQSISGRLKGQVKPISTRNMTILNAGAKYGSISMISLDGRDIGDSRKILIICVGRVKNSGMKWDKEKHFVLKWGTSPVLCEMIEAKVRLRLNGKRGIYVLDGSGRIKGRLGSVISDVVLGRESLLYLIKAEEKD